MLALFATRVQWIRLVEAQEGAQVDSIGKYGGESAPQTPLTLHVAPWLKPWIRQNAGTESWRGTPAIATAFHFVVLQIPLP